MVLLHPKPGCRILMRFCSSKSFHGRVCSCVTSPTVYLKKYRSFSAVACPAGICFCAVIFELLWGKAEKKGKNENLLYLYVLILWVIIRSQAIFLSLPSLLYYGLQSFCLWHIFFMLIVLMNWLCLWTSSSFLHKKIIE